MKLDKETLILIFVSMIILLGWEPFAVKMGWLPDPKEQKVVAVEQTKEQNIIPEEKNATKVVVDKAVETIAAEEVKAIALPKDIVLENDNVIVKFNPDYSALEEIVFKKFLNNAQTAPISVKNDFEAGLGMLQLLDSQSIVTLQSIAVESVGQDSIKVKKIATLKNGKKLNVTQTFKLNSDYQIVTNISFFNSLAQETLALTPAVWAGDLQSWSQLSGDEIRVAKFVYSYCTPNGEFESINGDAKEKEFLKASAVKSDWAAISNKFFALVFKSDNNSFTATVNRKSLGKKENILAFEARLGELKLLPNEKHDYNFTLYVGPKEAEFLKDVSPGCTKIIKFSWGPLNGLAKAMLWCLIKLYGLCGSYGWSIIILTVIVRLLFWPVTKKANESMKKMQSLKPQIDKLREQYKNNPQMLNMKTMELYKKEGANPLSGCLPILLQIPVFFALYATLDGAFALRQVPFLWVQNLAAPDTIFSFPLGFTIFGISNFDFNPLVIVMTILMVFQQKLTPTAMDPMQQKMMALMPIFMLIFLYELPSGLTLYWTVSQVFSILQLLLQRKQRKELLSGTK